MNNIFSKFGKVFAVGLTALALAACGNEAADSDVLKVGILQSAEHDALNSGREGFLDALEEEGYVDGENIEVTAYNSQGNQGNLQSMSQQLADDSDLILAISTSAAQSVANVEKEAPVLFTAVTDPVDAGLVESLENPGGNVTGTSDLGPVAEQVRLLISMKPESETVGVIYNSSEPNSQIQVDIAVEAIEEAGLEPVLQTVANSNDVQQAATSLLSDVDLLYIPTDNLLSSTAATVGDIAIDYQVPIVAGSVDHVDDGAVATISVNHYDLGKQTGRMAVRMLEEDLEPAEVPVEHGEDIGLHVNAEFAEAVGIDPDSITLPDSE